MDEGVRAMKQTVVKSAQRLDNGRISVKLEVNGKPRSIEVDTILVAIGRDTNPKSFGADVTGIKVSDSGKIIG